ncbi:MAG TPA: hypothetical protein VF885_13035 [Arthrobacter sp.]
MVRGNSVEQNQEERTAREDDFRRHLEAWAVGQATAAHQGGDLLFQIQLPVSKLVVDERQITSDADAIRHIPRSGEIIGRIETIGWTLEHVGYVSVQMGSSSMDVPVAARRYTANKGEVAGIYLFRRATA